MTVAGVLVYIETDGDRPELASLQALGEGRRIATALGATLYAFAAVAGRRGSAVGRFGHDELVTTLGRYGADKVLLVPAPAAEGPPRWGTIGEAFTHAYEHVRPMLVLLAANATGRDVGARIASRFAAAFVAEPAIERGPRGEIVFSRSLYGRAYRRRLAADDLDRTVVATLTPGSYRPADGDDEAEVVYIDALTEPNDRIEYLGGEEDPGAALEGARVVVTAGGGVRDEDTVALLADLARLLGGELGATRKLCQRGLAPPEREVGVGARHVAPLLYVACAASGSSSHLGAVAADAEIVAINIDPDAPIFRSASYGIVGDVRDVVADMIEALRARSRVAATS